MYVQTTTKSKPLFISEPNFIEVECFYFHETEIDQETGQYTTTLKSSGNYFINMALVSSFKKVIYNTQVLTKLSMYKHGWAHDSNIVKENLGFDTEVLSLEKMHNDINLSLRYFKFVTKE